MRLILGILLFLPTLVFANHPVRYIIIGEYIYDSEGNSIIVKQEAIIDQDGFEFLRGD